jgi:hypothetical protein
MKWLTDRLVDDWRRAWRWWSVQLHAFATGLLYVVQFAPVIPPELQAVIPQPWGGIATAAWAALGLLARILKQREARNAAR